MRQSSLESKTPKQTLSAPPTVARHYLLYEWNGSDESPPPRTLTAILAQVAERAPDAAALTWGDHSISYGEALRRARGLAHRLRDLGAGPETVVAFCLRSSAERILTQLAILHAGAAYLPLDPGLPSERLDFMLRDSGALLVLVEDGTERPFRTLDTPSLRLDANAWFAPREGEGLPEPDPQNLAYVIYTSGSTGRPKGVALRHQDVAGRFHQAQFAEFGPGRAVGQIANIIFDMSSWEIWGALLNGGRLTGLERDLQLTPRKLAHALRQQRIEILVLTAAVFHQAVSEIPDTFATLSHLTVGGEALDPQRTRECLDGGPPRSLVNGYGPTECTAMCSAHRLRAEDPPTHTVPIGKPLAATSLYVVDSRLRLLPPGTAGELVVGGVGVARGYLVRPGRTAQSFVADPFSGHPGRRLYRTGDRVVLHARGELEFLDRVDRQVKIRGYRVELGEIEARIRAHLQVVDAAVLVRREPPLPQRLVTFLTLEDPATAPPAQVLREVLGAHLPSYMVPDLFVPLDEMPLTESGKVDRKALQDLPLPEDTESDLDLIPPRTPLEETIASIARELLGREVLGVEQDLFELGANSLVVARLAARLERELGLEIAIGRLFEARTTAAIAGHLEEKQEAVRLPAPIPFEPVPRDSEIPLSLPQERIWFLSRLMPNLRAYNVQVALSFEGRLRPDVLLRALNEIVRRHEILRTTFPERNGRAHQVVQPSFSVQLPHVDLTALPQDRRQGALEHALYHAVRVPFHMDRLPLVRWGWFQVALEEHCILQMEHHFVHDGWSFSVLLHEIETLYQAYATGQPSPLAPPPVQFAEFAVWQRRYLESGVLERQLNYWIRLLEDRPEPIELPADRPRPEARTFDGDQVRELLSRDLYNELRTFGRRHGHSLFLLTLTAFDLLMARLAGRSTVVLATGVANRRRRETEEMLGMVVNTVLLRADLGPGTPFAELLPQVWGQVLDAHEHQDMPLEKIVEVLQPERRVGETPLARVLFSFHDSPVPDLDLPELSGRVNPLHNGTAKADLNVVGMPRAEQRLGREARDDDDEMLMLWEFDTTLFDRTTVLRMKSQYRVLLGAALANPHTPMEALPLLAKAESHQVLAEWNDTKTDATNQPEDVIEALALHFVARPDLVALEDKGLHLTYGALRIHAATLADALRQRGIGPEDRVPLSVSTSPDMVCAQLAVLWIGAAYVPCDPSWPTERIVQILEDCGAKVLLVDEPGAKRLEEPLQTIPTEAVLVRGCQIPPPGAPRTERRLFELGGGEAGGRARGTGGGWGSASFDADPRRDRPQEHLVGGSDNLELMPGIDRPSFAPPIEVTGQNLAYVLYTSGSTGKPKGVEIPRSGLANLVAWHRRRFPVNAGDGVGQMAGPAFDASVWDIWLALAAGATLHLATGDRRLSPTDLLDWILDRRLVSLLLPTPMGEAVLQQHWPRTTALRTLFLGGDRLHANALGTGAPAPVVNAYGPTENSVVATVLPLGTAGQVTDPSIGRPIDGVRSHVLDPFLYPAVPGMHGELCLAGRSLARGYAGQPAATAQSFVPNPFTTSPGERLYRTGDRVRALADGRLDFLGRLDHQVKVRGFRIELGEIESVLIQHPAVREAVVLPRQGSDGSTYLAAFLAGEGAIDTEALATHLAERLPRYMVPAHFVVLSELPKNTSGKIHRKALDGVGLPEPQGHKLPIQPRSPREEMVAGVWAEVLGLDEVGIHQDFFDLGGHSLLATRLATRLEKLFGVELPLRIFFESPTVAQVASLLEEAEGDSSRPPLERVSRHDELPLSFAQERLFFLHRLAPESPFYNVPLAWTLTGPLDFPALTTALAEIVRRHEILRTTFPNHQGRPQQHIAPPPGPPTPQIDLRGLPADIAQRTARNLAAQAGARPFRLGSEPLLRAALLRLDENEALLLLTLHHIVFDGGSMPILVQELSTLYDAFRQRLPSPLPERRLHYADFAAWQRRWLDGPVLEEQLVWWKEELTNLEPLELPLDRPRPSLPAFAGARLDRFLSADTQQTLRALGRSRGATLSMVLLAATAHLLGRWCDQEDVVIGSPVAGRHMPDVEELLGFFVNTLPLRVNLSDDPTFEQLVDRVRATALGAYGHQDLPFEQLVEEVQPERDLSKNPIFQVLSSLQDAPMPYLEVGDLRFEPFFTAIHTTHFDLEVNFWIHPEGLRATLSWDTTLFEATTATRLAGRLERLLTQVVHQPTEPLSHLPSLLSPAEAHQLQVEWNHHPASAPPPDVLHALLESTANRPDLVAVERDGSPGEYLTHGTLLARATALAGALERCGVGTESVVVVWFPPSVEMVVAQLAVLWTGAAYLPLDPDWPDARIAWMLSERDSKIVLVDRTLAERQPLQDTPGVEVLVVDQKPFSGPSLDLPREVPPQALAYSIYTSGSTGEPKAVTLHRDGLAHLVAWHHRHFPLAPGEGLSHTSGPAFDASTWYAWAALAAGATLHLPTAETRPSAAAMVRWLVDRRLTAAFLPTALGEAMLREPWPERAPLRKLLMGGDRLHGTALKEAPSVEVVNAYGPTENTVLATWARIDRRISQNPPIGRPVTGTRTHILDRRLHPVPLGAFGELCLTGKSQARGYAARPGLTAQSFVPDPFTDEPGERLYRTGDRVRAGIDGRLDFLGRLDHQVQVRGFRVELGEIEAVIRSHGDVEEALVIARDDGQGVRLLAFISLREGVHSLASLEAHLLERLPTYMVPSPLVVLPELPKNTSGKIDRGALAELELPKVASHQTSNRAITPREELVASVWREVLGVDAVGLDEDFFELGGHSLLATQVTARLERDFGVELPLRVLFESPTVERLARYLDQALTAERPPLNAGPQEGEAPLSFAQERLWFLNSLAPESPFYNVPLAWLLEGPLDERALTAALGEIVRRHGVLRTHFPPVDRSARAVVVPFEPPTIHRLDLRRLPRESARNIARSVVSTLGKRPFDLAHGPLLQLHLLRLADSGTDGAEESLLLFAVHHIVFDGWSTGVLLEELRQLYEAAREGLPSPLPALPVHYTDFARWQRRWLLGEPLERQMQWWRQRLEGAEILRLPTDRPRPAVPEFRGHRMELLLPPHIADGLRTLARSHRATLAMVLNASVAHLLGRWAQQDDVVLGTPIAGRTSPELELLIGFFVNSLALRIPLNGDPNFHTLVDRAREMALGAYSHQDLPFEQLVEELHPERDLSRNPLFQVMSTLQNAPVPDQRFGGLRLEPLPANIHTTHFDLELNFWPHGEGLRCVLLWDQSLFDTTTIERLTRRLHALAEGAAAEPGKPLSHFDLLAQGERHQVLVELSDSAASWPREAGLFDLFERHARKNPEAPAVLDGRAGETEVRTSYGKLYRRANALAHRLRELGVHHEALVAVLLDRGPHLAWIFPGILAASGAYLPLDTAHPTGRLRAMLHDSGAKVLITDGAAPGSLIDAVDHVLHLEELETLEADAPPQQSPQAGERLAYVLYTSGSTGRPKGVAVVQSAVSRLALGTNYVTLGPEDRIAQVSNASFDAATFEFWGALTTGAALVHIPTDVLLTPPLLGRTLEERGVTVLSLTMGPFHKAAEEAPEIFAGLRFLLFGAEAADPIRTAAVRRAMDAGQGGQLVHLYGPTESTSFATWQPVRTPPESGRNLPIGRPLANTTVHLLDDRLEPVPLGGVGALYLGGPGLARAYWQRPALTATAFVPDPYGPPGTRLYATGDRGRRTASGILHFLGRADQQVKVRGFRLEPGEVEAVLEEHAAVVRAVVLPHPPDAEGSERRLAAWLVRDASYQSEDTEAEAQSAESIEQWQLLFDDAYDSEGRGAEPTFNIVGWNRTADGTPIPAHEMRAWLEDTAQGILRLKPRRLLELGCGTGLVLFRVAPHTEHYTATDISQRGLDFIDSVRRGLEDPLPQVDLHPGAAHELDHLPTGTYDTVVLNSVAQYFPSAAYLAQVIEGVLPRVAPGGRFFLGDVRSLPLGELLHGEIALEQAQDGDSPSELRRRIAGALLNEDELLVHPHFFHALAQRLPRSTRVEIFPKEAPQGGELGSYRYQVVLHFDSEPWPELPGATLSWRREGLALANLQHRLQATSKALALESIPNARLHRATLLHDALRDPDGPQSAAALRAHLETTPPEGVEPTDLVNLANELGWSCTLSWDNQGTDGAFDALLWPAGESRPEALPTAPPTDLEDPLERWTNRPYRGRFARRVLPQIRTFLEERLPDYMVPQHFALLDELPLTPNGKLDRQALPEPELGQGGIVDPTDLAVPRTPHEEIVAGIWGDVLAREHLGVEEDFFALGGHSLLATQVASQLRDAFGLEVPLRTLFEHSTIATQAAWIAAASTGADEATKPLAEPPMVRLERRPGRLYPASFPQLREWILESIQPGTTLYHIAAPTRLVGRLDPEALEAALRLLVSRHEALRTALVAEDGEPRQRLHPTPETILRRVDLRGLPPELGEAAATAAMGQELATPFDLGGGSLLRAVLFQLGEDDQIWTLTLHHIIADGWSTGLLQGELNRLYDGLVAGRTPRQVLEELPELPLQYVDFAAWQRSWLDGEGIRQLVEPWRQRLEGSPPLLELPLDRPRPAVRSHDVGRLLPEIPALLRARAEAFAHDHRASLYMVLLTAFEALLFRLTGQRDLALGTLIANRNRSHTAGIVGFFTNTLVLRTQLDPGQGATHNLERIKDTTLDAYAHQDLPFEKLLDALEVTRSTAHSPLFQVMFSLHNLPGDRRALGGLEARTVASTRRQADFDLEIGLHTVGDRLVGEVKYSLELFDRTTVARWLDGWRALLEACLEEPDVPLVDLPLITPAQRHQLVVESRGPRVDAAGDAGLHRAIARRVALDPGALAVDSATGEALTYGDLLREARRLAHRLRSYGVASETVVALAVEPGPLLVTALLAVLEAGGTYLPLDLEQPTQRLAYILEDAKAHCLLTSANETRHQPLVTAFDLPTCQLEAELEASAAEPDTPLRPEPHPEQLAYILYTSGTTGEPKGVGVPHRAVLDFLYSADHAYGLKSGDRILQFAALTFDTSVEELFPALCRGATVVYAEGPRVKSPADFLRQAEDLRLTVLDLPTAYWHVLLADPAFRLPPAVRLAILGGEKAQASALVAWKQRVASAVRLYNSYGPSEATVVTLGCDLAGPRALPVKPPQDPPIGFPMPNVQALLLDAGGRPVPRGAAGEIHLGGPGLARGYLNRPALTAERFVPDPNAEGARLYRTGDRARLRVDGAFEFLGRIDDQVKVRGLRVEPGEVAAVLVRHPAVEEGEVLLRSLPSGQQGLVAYAAVKGSPEEAELRDALRNALPEYMVPAAFVLLDELPKTTSSKVDRRALLRLDITPTEPTSTAPQSAFEGRIAAVWAEVLGIERVGIDDNFFDLGGDSLLLLRLHSRLEERLERSFKVLDLFQHTTVRSLARHLGGGDEGPRHREARKLVEKRKAARRRRKPRRR